MDMNSFAKILCFCTLLVLTQGERSVDYMVGVMKIISAADINASDICFSYPPKYFTVPTTLLAGKRYNVTDWTDVDPCSPDTDENSSEAGKDSVVVMKKDDNCTLSNYFDYARGNGSGIILIANRTQPIDSNYSSEVFIIIGNKSAERLLEYRRKGDIEIQLLTVEDRAFNPNLLILWAIAFICVTIGSYTGPYKEIPSTPSEQQILDGSGRAGGNKDQFGLNVIATLIMVVFISSALLLLYFFYKYLVYFFMAIFCFASARATYDIWLQVLKYFKLDTCGPRIRGAGIQQISLMLVCITVPVVWFFFRHSTFAWILQDYLGICFCIHIIQTLRMPNLKVCSILLGLLFVYDIFFVFITPFFTADGQSVMIEVATGGSSGEELPLLLKVPQLMKDILSACSTSQKYSLLGFGDIIVPGFLVCFAHSFDIFNGETRTRPYFLATLTGYGFGLAIAFVVLTLSQTGQPALLYVVPSVLIPIYVVAMCKNQFKVLWDNSE